uniref:LRAT domain-containing protein n=1 Tax=Parastrongyloides trichosuri TaxID=131310 RepID=A0A0N4ZRQ8_PARTI
MNYKLKTPWVEATELIEHLQIGDLIEFKRATKKGIKIYSHWGIYIGSKNDVHGVAHLAAGPDSDKEEKIFMNKFNSGCFVPSHKALVRIDDLLDISQNDKCRINNSLDCTMKPLPQVIIYERVKLRLGDSGYNLFNNNCEHFVKWVRYNTSSSNQANIGKAFIYGVGILALSSNPMIAMASGGLGYLCLEGIDLVRKKFPVDACIKHCQNLIPQYLCPLHCSITGNSNFIFNRFCSSTARQKQLSTCNTTEENGCFSMTIDFENKIGEESRLTKHGCYSTFIRNFGIGLPKLDKCEFYELHFFGSHYQADVCRCSYDGCPI